MTTKTVVCGRTCWALAGAAIGLLLAHAPVEAANVIKLDTASMAANTSNWSAAPATNDVGEFDGTCSAGSLGALTLGGANLSLGGLLFDGTMAGPATILSGNTLNLATMGINMASANQDVTVNCGVGIVGNQTWNVGSGRALALGAGVTANSGSGVPARIVTKSGGGALNVNGQISFQSSGGGEGFLVNGGSVSATGVLIGRNSYPGSGVSAIGVPIGYTVPTGSGFYVNGVSTVVSLTGSSTTSTIGAQNSGATMRIDGGAVTMAGPLVLGRTTNSRYSIMQVNGGSFSNSNGATGLQIAPNSGAIANNADLYLTGGVAAFEKIGFGASTDTAGGIGYLTLAGGTLYLGSGGIVRNTTVGTYNANICLNSGTLGAKADWSTSLGIALNGAVTIQAADAAGVARTITLGGNISTISGTGAIVKTGDGTLVLAGANTYAGCTRINAGTLQVGSGGTSGNLSAADAIAITNNGALAFKRSDSVTFSGVISGSGAVKQLGGGTLTLSGDNTYAGGTTVNAGTLLANNNSGLGTGAVRVQGSGLLGGTGVVSVAVTVNAGGGLAPGNSVGTLTVSSLTLGGGATNLFEFNGAPANDQVVVTTSGGLVLDGGAFKLFEVGGSLPWMTPGSYGLIQYSGALSGAATDGLGNLNSDWTTVSETNPHIVNPQPGYTYAFGASGGWLTLTISASVNNGTWAAGADGNWSEAGNWTAVAGAMPPRNAGDIATLGDSATLRTVTLDADVSVGSLIFNNANSFVVADGGRTLTLDKAGSGVTVSITDGAANEIQSAVSLNDDASVIVSGGKALAISGPISNTAAGKTLSIDGAGTLTLSGDNRYGPAAGGAGTSLSGGGVLRLGHSNALGAGDVSISGNYTLQAGAFDLSVGNSVDIGAGVLATVDSDGRNLALSGAIRSSGALAKSGAGALSLGTANTYAGGTAVGAGVVSVSAEGAIAGMAGSLGVVPATASPNNVVLNGGALLGVATLTLHANRGIGVGPAVGAVGATALIDAVGGQTLTVNGVIASAGNSGANALTVNSLNPSAGTVALGGANTFNGTTVVAGGTLRLANALALQNSLLDYDNLGGTLSFGSLTAATLGGLRGAQNLALANDSAAAVTLTVGGNGSSPTFSGMLSGAGALGKIGAGTQTLLSAGYSGSTVVYHGGVTFAGASTLSTHLDISAQYGVARVTVDGASLTSPNGLYITSPSGGSGTIYGNNGHLFVTNGGQVVANADVNGRALSYGSGGNHRPSGNGTLSVGGTGDTATRVTVNGILDMFATAGGGTFGNFAVNLNGGTLAVQRVQQNNAGTDGIRQTATFKFNGGVLLALTNDTTAPFFTGIATAFSSTVLAGGAVIDDNGFSITVASTFTHGAGTPDGGLTKRGSGTLTRSGASTYTGPTAVNAGTLWVNGTHSGGLDYTVAGGATLGGTGTVALASGTVTVQAGATLAPGFAAGAASGGALSLSALALDASAGLVIDSAADQVAVSGNVALSGNAVTVLNGDGFDRAVRYPILTCAGEITGALARETNDPRWVVKRDGNTFVLANYVGSIVLVK